MKLTIFMLAAAAGVLSHPAEQPSNPDDMQTMATCYHPSSCSTHWAGLCEDYCKGHGGFSHMTDDGCGIFQKKCCCNRR